MHHPEITPLEVQIALRHTSRGFYEMELARRATGIRPTDEDMIERSTVSEDYGDGITTNGFRHLLTSDTLQGSALLLRPQTYIRYESFTLPENVTQRSVEDLMYGRSLATVAFTRIYINELGISFMGKERAKPPVTAVYRRTPDEDLAEHHAATEGIVRYLNGALCEAEDSIELETSLSDTLRYIGNIRFDENSYVDSVLDIIIARQNPYQG